MGYSRRYISLCHHFRDDNSNAREREIAPSKVTLAQAGICTSMLVAALFTITKGRKRPKYPSPDEWINKMRIHTIEHYSVLKRKDIEICYNIGEP